MSGLWEIGRSYIGETAVVHVKRHRSTIAVGYCRLTVTRGFVNEALNWRYSASRVVRLFFFFPGESGRLRVQLSPLFYPDPFQLLVSLRSSMKKTKDDLFLPTYFLPAKVL